MARNRNSSPQLPAPYSAFDSTVSSTLGKKGVGIVSCSVQRRVFTQEGAPVVLRAPRVAEFELARSATYVLYNEAVRTTLIAYCFLRMIARNI
jgi:hypothetical protein